MGQNFSTSFIVDQTPQQVFAAITNVRAWWTGDIEGSSQKRGDEFSYRYQDIHYSKQKLTEVVPYKKIVWRVIEASLNFVKDKNEWTNTEIVFEITPKGDQTELRFTHVGLVPEYECFDSCSSAWSVYINGSLRNLITNAPKETNMSQNFSTSFTVDQTPQEVFAAINNVRGWWSEEVEGSTEKLGDVYYYHFEDVHRVTIKLTEVIPNKKVVWRVLDNYFNFIQDQNEWVNTEIVFEITEKGSQTELHFTHVGLVPAYECFGICSNAWTTYINGSLRNLITTGKGQPNAKERPTTLDEKILLEARPKG